MNISFKLLFNLSTVLVLSAACSKEPVLGSGSLVIKSSSGEAPELMSFMNIPKLFDDVIVGDVSKMNIKVYELWLSAKADCSDAEQVVDYGSEGENKDFTAGDVLFSASPADGTYKCLMMRMSDIIDFESEEAGSICETDTEYTMDIFRDETWKNADGTDLEGSGTDEDPVDNKPFTILTTDMDAALGEGFHENQTVELSEGLVVPGNATFYFSGVNSVVEEGDSCRMSPSSVGFGP